MIQKKTSSFFFALLLAACGQDYKATSQMGQQSRLGDVDCAQSQCDQIAPDPGTDNNETPLPPQPNPPPANQVDKAAVNASVSGGMFDKTKVVEYDSATGIVQISVPLPALPFELGLSGRLPGDLDGEFGILPSLDGGSKFFVRLPLNKLAGVNGGGVVAGLPSGDPLPLFNMSKLPRYDLRKGTDAGAYLYLSEGVVAVFVPTEGFNPFVQLTFPIKNQNRKTLGYFATIPKKKGFAGGFFVSFVLPEEVAGILPR